MLTIGQSLECWRPPLSEAMAGRDTAPLIAGARQQVRSGAVALDLNFGATRRAGLADHLGWAAEVVRAALPEVVLFLDCGDLEALARAVEATAGPVVANAVPLHDNLTPDPWRLIEAAARAGAGVVVSPRAADERDDDGAILDAARAAQ